MADTIKKYLDQAGLEALVAKIKSEDDAHQAAAQSYADGLAKNYDAVGSAATAKSEAIEAAKTETTTQVNALANGAVKANTDAIAILNGGADVDGSVAKAVAGVQANVEAEAARAKAAEEANAAAAKQAQDEVDALELVVKNIQENAYDDTEIRGLITGLENNKADKTQVATDIAAAVKVETDARVEAVKGVQDAVDGLAGTHATDKKALEDAIALKADQTALDEVAEVAEAAVKQSDYDVKVKALEDEDTRIAGLVSAEETRAKGVEEGLQTQINTIMNNPDAEGAINSINEFTQYVKDHGTIAEGFRTDIDKNKDDIAAEVKRAGEAESALSGRLDTLEAIDHEAYVGADTALENKLNGEIAKKVDKTAYDAKVEELAGADSALSGRLDDVEAALGTGEGSVADQISDAKAEAIETAAEDATTKAGQALTDAKAYTDAEVLKDRSRLDALEEIDHEHANKELLDTYTQTEANLADAVAKKHEHANAAELAKVADGDVAKWNAAEGNAKAYADAEVAKDRARLDAVEAKASANESAVATKAEQEDLDEAVERIAANELAIQANASAIAAFQAIPTTDIDALFA